MQRIKVAFPTCKYYGEGVRNVTKKFLEYMPEDYFELVDDWMNSDLVIESQIIGTPDRDNLVHPGERGFSEEVKIRLDLAEMGMFKLANIFHCAIVDDDYYRRSLDVSLVSAGFLDLNDYIQGGHPKWLRIPWGVETWDFLRDFRVEIPEYTIYSWGCSFDPEEECIRSIYEAVKEVNGKMLHSGVDYKFDNGKHYVYLKPASSKQEISERYNMCKYANAMRQEDGFELANLEAILSNARPITIGRGSCQHFFSSSSIMVVQDKIKEQLINMFKSDYQPIGMDEKAYIIENFSWKNSTKKFWDIILKEFNGGK